MEQHSQPLSVSDAWLLSPNRSFRLDGASFIEMDPNLTPSKRFLVHDQDFADFNVPKSQQLLRPMNADYNLISNGRILLQRQLPPLTRTVDVSPLPSADASTREEEEEGRLRKSRSMSLHKCKKLQKTIIQKYMDLVRPLWCRMRRSSADGSRSGDQESSKTSGVGVGGRCCDSETSIHEAVVHCKKTIGIYELDPAERR